MIHHYIFSAGMKGMISRDRGKIYLKHGPYYFTRDDLEKMQRAVIMANDPWIKTSQSQANEICGCKELVNTLSAMSVAAKANGCTMHHIYAEFEVSDKWFIDFVESCNTSEYAREKLERSRIS